MSPALFGLLLQAAVLTVTVSVTSIVIGLGLGAGVAMAMVSPRRGLSGPARLFVSFFRGVPLLVQLLLIYNLLPVIGIDLPSVLAAIVGLSLCTAAYQAENLRGALLTIPRGLIEAADMAGLSGWQRFRRIQAPLAFRLALPSVVNEAILILKASSLASVVGVVELTRMAQDLAASTYLPLQLFASAGLVYLAINWSLAGLGSVLERRLNRMVAGALR
jgi:polar amino acid transport system permease protein